MKSKKIQLSKVLKRELKGKSLSIVSKETGIPSSSLHGYMNGVTPRRMEHLFRLSHYTDLSLDELLFNQSRFSEESTVLTSHKFSDNDQGEKSTNYKITIEKIRN